MIESVEITSIDVRYEGHRMRNARAERELFVSILEKGIQEPLEGVARGSMRILLNGFKRYRCAKKIGLGIVPYTSLGSDEAEGILQLLRISNAKGLSILEQARLIDELRKIGMGVGEIARQLSRSKSWVSVRIGICDEMSDMVREKIFSGAFPVYSYMYTVRQFMRINSTTQEEVEKFVRAVSGKNLSIRDIEQLAHGYFKGSEEFRQQIQEGHIGWCLGWMRRIMQYPESCNGYERIMLRDLEITQRYMHRVKNRITDHRYKNNSFYAQANLLAGGILNSVHPFCKAVKEFYDRTRQA